MRPLDEQTILIAGASDGLGRALAAELAAAGCDLSDRLCGLATADGPRQHGE